MKALLVLHLTEAGVICKDTFFGEQVLLAAKRGLASSLGVGRALLLAPAEGEAGVEHGLLLVGELVISPGVEHGLLLASAKGGLVSSFGVGRDLLLAPAEGELVTSPGIERSLFLVPAEGELVTSPGVERSLF